MRTIEVKGKQYPVFGLLIERIFSPLKPQQLTMPPAPAGLTGKEWIKWHNETTLELEEAIKAERKRWLASREPVTRIEIEFMAWKWFGGIAGLHIETIDGGRLDELCRMVLPDGTLISGRVEDLPDGRVVRNAAILREERESGIDYTIDRVFQTVQTIDANVKPHKQAKNAEKGVDAAMKKRDHKRRKRKTTGAEAQYPKETIQRAVAEINKRVKKSKGKLSKRQAAEDVRKAHGLLKVDAEYLRRECYERKSAKPSEKGKTTHR